MILGLDISTTRTGVAVIDERSLLLSVVIDHSCRIKYPTDHHRADFIMNTLYEIRDSSKYNIEHVVVEKNLKAGGNTNTVVMLAKMNATVCDRVWRIFDMVPVDMSANTARKLVGIEQPKKSTRTETKKRVIQWCVDNESEFVAEYTKAGNPKKGVDDKADAIVTARALQVKLLAQRK